MLLHCDGADTHRHVEKLDNVKKHEQAIKNRNERENRSGRGQSRELHRRRGHHMHPGLGKCRRSFEYFEVNIGRDSVL
jgi:hypothetical protein